MKKLNNRGFTLIELLAVIVILAVVMIIAATAMGSTMSDARQSSFAKEGMTAIDAAKFAFQKEQLKPSSGISAIKNICMDISWLYQKGYYTKGSGWAANKQTDGSHDGYVGSVLITYSNGVYTHKVWMSDGNYIISGKTSSELYDDYSTTALAYGGSDAPVNCGGSGYDIICSGADACKSAN